MKPCATVLLFPEGPSAPQPDPPPNPAEGSDLRVLYTPGQTLARAVYLSGHFAPPALCSGLSLCGRCRMRVLSPPPSPVPADTRLFSPQELALGWRLACRHQPAPGMRVELPPEIRGFAEGLAANLAAEESGLPRPANAAAVPAAGVGTEPPVRGVFHGTPASGVPAAASGGTSCLAVDLGTTSLQWRHLFLSPQGYRVLAQGGVVNPQMGAGSDVISRLSVAADPRGRKRLSQLTRNALKTLVEQCAARARGRGLSGEVSAICLAANTAMTAITLDLDVTGLARAPYSLPCAGGRWEELAGLPKVWLPPQPAPFVGGDIAAGYAALALDPARPAPAYPFLLADLGTNGEFLLALGPTRAFCASVALGPALEGIGLRHGTEARPKAVSAFSLTPRGLHPALLPDETRNRPLPAHEPGETGAGRPPDPDANTDPSPGHEEDAAPAPPGITGTGYLSLLSILLTAGAMDRQGRFTPETGGLLKRLFALPQSLREPSGEARLPLPFGLYLTASDVEEILKVKAAFSLGLRRLLAHAGLASGDLAHVHVAGALGSHVDKRALEELGFFPQGMAARLQAAGNTSLDGAALLLREPPARQALIQWAKTVTPLDLASDQEFARTFADHMRFVW